MDNKNNGNSKNCSKTNNGIKQASGMVSIDVKIFNIEKNMSVFVINNTNYEYDFLIGLDCIRNFICQNGNSEINQRIPK